MVAFASIIVWWHMLKASCFSVVAFYFILLVLLWSCYTKVLALEVSRLLSYHPWDLATKLPLVVCVTIFKIWRFKHFLYQTMINLSFIDSHVDNMLCRIATYARHVVVWTWLTNCLGTTTIIPMCDRSFWMFNFMWSDLVIH